MTHPRVCDSGVGGAENVFPQNTKSNRFISQNSEGERQRDIAIIIFSSVEVCKLHLYLSITIKQVLIKIH